MKFNQCENCKKKVNVVQLFRGKWLCMDCWIKKNNIKDNKYYRELFERSKKIE